MTQLPIKTIILFLFTLLLASSISIASETNEQLVTGVLQDVKTVPGKQIQIQLDENWYAINGNSDIFMCDQKMTDKNLNDLTEYIDYRLNLASSTEGTFNKIYILCE